MKQWYVLYTRAHAERKVLNSLLQDGHECYLPTIIRPRKWSDRIKNTEVALMPSYLFVCTTDEVLRTLNSTNGVSRIVFFNRAPAIVSAAEIEALRTFCLQAEKCQHSFLTNDEVRIMCGPLKGQYGKILKVGNNKLVLCIEQTGMQLCLHTDQVVKV